MNMLTRKDLDLIGAEVAKVIEDNINPRFDAMDELFDRLESRVDRIEDTMVTKDYLDDKLGQLHGDLIVNDRLLEHRLDRHLEGANHEELESLRLFPRPGQLPG
jgi:hypothetical protein